MERKLYGAIASSQDSTQVANKIKGLILAGSSIIIMVAGAMFQIQLSANDVLSLATEVGAVAGSVWAIYGAILHLVTIIGTVRSK